MRLIFTDDYRQYRKGDIIEVGSGVAVEYLKRGVVEEVELAERHEERKRAVRPVGRPRK